jgi:hypothetical protein
MPQLVQLHGTPIAARYRDEIFDLMLVQLAQYSFYTYKGLLSGELIRPKENLITLLEAS